MLDTTTSQQQQFDALVSALQGDCAQRGCSLLNVRRDEDARVSGTILTHAPGVPLNDRLIVYDWDIQNETVNETDIRTWLDWMHEAI